MVLEIAQIDVKPGMEAEFEAGVAKAAPIFRRAKGCTAMAVQRSVEKPSRYRLLLAPQIAAKSLISLNIGADDGAFSMLRVASQKAAENQ
jgi:hypothetical protein